MIEQIKCRDSVISPFNPVVSFSPKSMKRVNEQVIYPKLEKFFEHRGGIDSYEALDPDKIQTDIEFKQKESQESYVKSYIYKELMNTISKNDDGSINFKRRYVVSFDEDLTPCTDKTTGMKYGELKLGMQAILYFIYIDLQDIISFIKQEK
jgi:hypothetical protein